MKTLTLAILAAICAASTAQAQTTNCRPTIIGMPSAGITCDTTGARQGAAVSAPRTLYSWKDVKPAPCSRMEKLADGSNYCDAREAAANHKAVGDLIAGGKCDDAIKMALGMGDLEFASQVKGFCAQK